MRPRLAFRLPLDSERLFRARERLRDYLHEQRIEPSDVRDVVLAVEEAMTNAVRHSQAGEDLHITLELEDGDLIAEVRDGGQGFDAARFDREKRPDLLAPGGRGLYLMAHLMDEIELHCNGGTAVRMRKHLRSRSIGDSLEPTGRPDDEPSPRLESDRRRASILARTASRLLSTQEPQQIVEDLCREVMESLDCHVFFNFLVDEKLGCLRLNAFAGIDEAEAQTIQLLDYGVAVCGCAAQERRRLVAEDIQHSEDERASLVRSYGVQAYAAHPLIVRGRLLGTLSFGARDRPNFTEEELSLMETVAGQVAIAIDRQQTERSLRESERKYQRLLENRLLGVAYCEVIVDGAGRPIDYRFLEVNEAFERMTGLGAETVVGRTAREAMPGIQDSEFDFIGIHGRVALTGEEASFESYQELLGRWYEVIVYCPEPGYFVSLFHDITERKQAEEARRESEQRLRFHLENTPLAVIEWDKDFVVTRWAGEAEAIFGWTASETLGKPIMDLGIFFEDDVTLLEQTKVQLTDGEHDKVISTHRNHTRDDRVIDCTWYHSVLYDDQRRMQSVMSLVEDKTERKQAEQSLLLSLELGQALTRIQELVHSSLESPEVMATALMESADALGAESGAIDGIEAGEWVVWYDYGSQPSVIGHHFTDQENAHGVLAAQSREVVAIEDCYADWRVNREVMRAFGLRSCIVAPLVVKGETLACLYLNYSSGVHRFSWPEVEFVRNVASSLSLALENAGLYEEQSVIARTLQENFLHPLPALEHLEIGLVGAVASAPALVGGDLWDVFELPDKRVAVIIGDVAGKGIPAAALTETARSTMRAFAHIDASPAFILRKTNEVLIKSESGQFVTALVAVVDVQNGQVSIASAGHPGPVHLRGLSCLLVDPPYGPPLGTFPCEYSSSSLTLGLEDTLVLYTDGVTEARRDRELFGEKRLVDLVSRLGGRPAQEVAQAVRDAAEDFAGILRDDLQVVTLRLK